MKSSFTKIFAILFPSILLLLVLIGTVSSYKYTGELNIFENIKASIMGALLASAVAARLYPNAKKAKATKTQIKAIRISLTCLLIAVIGYTIMLSGYETFGKILTIPSVFIGTMTVLYMMVTGQNRIPVE